MFQPPLSDNERDELDQFSRAVWGNPKAVLRRSGDIEFIDLGGYPAFLGLLVGAVWYDKILVREEYRIALQTLETERYSRGAYVTGQPGIGNATNHLWS